MSNNKQSSVVDWIFSQLPDEYTTTRSGFDVYKQAKAMHKEEIIKAVTFGQNNHTVMVSQDLIIAEQYHKETFKSE